MCADYRTDNAIKNHWNSTMRRKCDADWNRHLRPVKSFHTSSCVSLAKPNAMSCTVLRRPELLDSFPAPTFVWYHLLLLFVHSCAQLFDYFTNIGTEILRVILMINGWHLFTFVENTMMTEILNNLAVSSMQTLVDELVQQATVAGMIWMATNFVKCWLGQFLRTCFSFGNMIHCV